MKKNICIVKLMTVMGLFALLLLQIIWFYGMYNVLWNKIKEKANSDLKESLIIEAIYQLEKLPISKEPKSIATGKNLENGKLHPEYTALQNGLYKMGSRLSLSTLDSIYRSRLNAEDIKVNFVLNHISLKDTSVIETTDSLHSASFDAIYTEIIPIREDHSEGIQAVLVNPYHAILEQMTLLLVATAVVMIFIGICIAYQIKIILWQRQIAKERQDFIYAMIHDMKSPLNVIMVGLHILYNVRLNVSSEKWEKSYSLANKAVEHLLALTNKVLTLAKMESGKVRLNKQEVDLVGMIQGLEDSFTLKAEKTVVFENNLQMKTVFADAEYLKEAISNLIDNAIKYSGEEVRIRIQTDRKGGRVQIAVEDNGFGIPPESLQKIFEKYERAAAANRIKRGGATGFGLGLSYVSQVASAHGGEVRAESVEGEYSLFTICIPEQEGLIVKSLKNEMI